MSKARSNPAKALGFSPERLRRIDRFLEDHYIAPGRLPCVHVLVARHGEVAHQTVLGRRDVERDLPAKADTVYRIYSMTKPVTSVVLMMLVEEGLVALDDPVAKYIPAWANLGVFAAGTPGAFLTTPAARPMQVIDLLRHTSGLTYSFQNRTNLDAAYRELDLDNFHGARDLKGFIDALGEIPLEFSPGEAWNYSVATDVLGYLIEVITGQSLDQAFKARIFDPLKMDDTGFFVRKDQAARFASCYAAKTPTGGLKLQDDARKSPFLEPPAFHSGGGGLVSTAADYLRFTTMLARGGELDGARILAPKTVRLMRANHLDGRDLTEVSRSLFSESTNAGVGFGLGFATVFDPVRTLLPGSPGEFYWGGAASTAFWIDPVEDISVVFMTQFLPSSQYPVRRQLRTLVHSALMEPA